ncbi:MAG: LacI family DNA-binding transcriptional regulator [Pyrinomonadaceae bacterium]
MNIKKVAEHAGVSTATVSRLINKTSYISPGTAKKVWRAIEELGYHPNVNARGLASGKSSLLGLIVSDIVNPFFPDLVKSFDEAALHHGYEIITANTNYDETRTLLRVRRLIERRVDGVAIMTSEMDQALVDELSTRGIPIVFLDTGKVKENISNIRIDYEQGVSQAVNHLLELGHRRIGYISGPLGLKSARIRRSAFLKFLKKKGIIEEKELVTIGDYKISGGKKAMEKLLKLEDRPTAVLTSNDLTAIGAMQALRSHGLHVPEDVSLIGFDDIALAATTDPPLTTVNVSRVKVAECAFESLLELIKHKTQKGREVHVGTHLVIRESTAKPSPKTRRSGR